MALRWKMMKEIVGCLQEIGAEVFGGFCRDKILHDHYADTYYSQCSSELEGEACFDSMTRYTDPAFHPDTYEGRCTLPEDIDCFMLTNKIERFVKLLSSKLFSVKKVFDNALANSYLGCAKDVRHTRLCISFAVNPMLQEAYKLSKHNVIVDIVHSSNKKELPLGGIDFECNAIILTANDDYMISNKLLPSFMNGPKYKLDKLVNIIEDIKNKRAVTLNDNVPAYRIRRMLYKGWTVVSANSVTYPKNTSYEGYCIVCHDTLDKACQFKARCCDARYHGKCMREFVNNTSFKNECPVCKKQIRLFATEKNMLLCAN